MSENMAYLAAAVDCDGSVWITVQNTRYKRVDGTSEDQFTFGLNIRQTERGRSILDLALETFGAGHISGPHKNNMMTWQTSTGSQIVEILHKLYPYLRVKRLEADLMFEALDLYLNTPREGGFRGRPRVSQVVKNRVKEISTLMNAGQQKETSRRNKSIRELVQV